MLTRTLKEARPLAAPAILILVATSLALTWMPAAFPGWSIGPALAFFYLGTAVLVAVPFGAEFQHCTLLLLLSQPEPRARLWLRKWAVIGLVLAAVTGLQYAALSFGPFTVETVGRELTFLLVVLCSGTLWTLLAGSTIGGVAFTLAALLLLEMTANLVAIHLFGASLDLFSFHPVVVAARVAYMLTTLWLGWRIFARLEIKAEGAAGGHWIATGPLWDVLRCRPEGALGNLIRKEIRLQAPTLQIATVFVACWLAAIGYFAVTPARPSTTEAVFIVMLAVYCPLALVVSGTISLGEDTALGIRAWHLTLPVSSRAQWLVKLAVSAFVGAVAAIALPLALGLLASVAVPLPDGRVPLPGGAAVLVAAGILVVAFWAAALLGHTVRAAVATGLALVGLAICARIGIETGLRLGIWDSVLTWLMVRNQWPPQLFFVVHPGSFGWLAVIASGAIVAVVALVQSLRAFRRAQVDRQLVATYGGLLALVCFLVTFGISSYQRAAGNQWRSAPVRELRAAIEAARPPAGPARVVSLAELEATGLVSDATRRWLSGSEVTVESRSVPWRTTPGGPAEYRILHRVHVVFPNGQTYDPLYFLPASGR
jgi:hypothetical protein